MSKSKSATNGAVNRISDNVAMHTEVTIKPPNIKTAVFTIIGTSPHVQSKFSSKAKAMMKANEAAGSTGKKGKKRDGKDHQDCYEKSMYRPSGEKWEGGAIPATQIRDAMIASCRLTGYKMTHAKQSINIQADGYDPDECIPLIRVKKGGPRYFEQALRNSNGGAEVRVRGMWEPGWEADARIDYDADLFTLNDVASLLMRAGTQCGIGEGRMASRDCSGLGWGAFKILGM